MALQGSLRDMLVADLIQHTCQDGKTARITIDHNQQQAYLFFEAGELVDAELGDQQGEEVIYNMLSWQDGDFKVEPGVPASRRTIMRNYTGVLLTGAQRLDEFSSEVEPSNIFQEAIAMAPKKKSELLADTLSDLLTSSSDIEGAAVVGTDGLVYSINMPTGKVDETLAGAVAAAALGLSKRSADQLKRGAFTQTLIQGDKGNIILMQLDPQTLLVELTPPNVNLGMAFAETREVAGRLREIL